MFNKNGTSNRSTVFINGLNGYVTELFCGKPEKFSIETDFSDMTLKTIDL